MHWQWQTADEEYKSYLGQRYNNERAPAGALCDDSHKLGVDSTEVVVMDVLGDGDTVEAVLPVGHLSIHISKLGASVGRTPWHLWKKQIDIYRFNRTSWQIYFSLLIIDATNNYLFSAAMFTFNCQAKGSFEMLQENKRIST